MSLISFWFIIYTMWKEFFALSWFFSSLLCPQIFSFTFSSREYNNNNVLWRWKVLNYCCLQKASAWRKSTNRKCARNKLHRMNDRRRLKRKFSYNTRISLRLSISCRRISTRSMNLYKTYTAVDEKNVLSTHVFSFAPCAILFIESRIIRWKDVRFAEWITQQRERFGTFLQHESLIGETFLCDISQIFLQENFPR